MKSQKVNLVTAFKWLENVLEIHDIPAAQQLVLFQLTIAFNRQFWRPTPLSLNKLAAACSKDKRTVKSALEKLIESGLVVEVEGGYTFGINERLGGISQESTSGIGSKKQGRFINSADTSGENVNVEIDPELAKQFG